MRITYLVSLFPAMNLSTKLQRANHSRPYLSMYGGVMLLNIRFM